MSGPTTFAVGYFQGSSWVGIGRSDASFILFSEPDWSPRRLQTVWHVVAPSVVVSAVVLSVRFEGYGVTAAVESHFACSVVPLTIEVVSLRIGDTFKMVVLVGLAVHVLLDMLSSPTSVDSFMPNLLEASVAVIVHLVALAELSFPVGAQDATGLRLISFTVRAAVFHRLAADVALLHVPALPTTRHLHGVHASHHRFCLLEHLVHVAKPAVFEEGVVEGRV